MGLAACGDDNQATPVPRPTSPIHSPTATVPPFDNPQTYTASGYYEITYPADQYAAEPVDLEGALEGSAMILRPTTGDGYQITLAASAPATATLDDPLAVIDQSVLLRYQPELVQVRRVVLGEIPALRLDNLPFGPQGFMAHILCLRGDMLIEILVEPQPAMEDDAQRETVNRVIASFRLLPAASD
jgi:hypothetical protein